MKKTNYLSLLLTALLTCASCGNGAATDGTTATDTDAASDSVQDTYVEDTAAIDALPDGDYGGREVNMLVRREFLYEFGADESGDIVDDAVYDRNRKIKEKFGIKLTITDVEGSFSTRDTFLGVLTGDIMSGSGDIDIVAGAANYMLPTVPEGNFVNLMQTPYIETDKPWWSQGYVDNMSIDGGLYLATGTASINLLDNMCVTFFNKKLIEDHGFDSPYDLVKSGKWTIGKLLENAKTVNTDLDGDGKLTLDDRIGILTYNNMLIAQQVSFGLRYSERGEDGYPRITYMSERMTEAFELIRDSLNQNEMVWYAPGTDTLSMTADMQAAFQNGNVLYMNQVLSSAGMMRSMDQDFGIVPMPKLGKEQDRYYTCVMENLTVLGIPASAKDTELSGLVLEALARIGYDTVTPVYFEKALGTKYVRDDDSSEMLSLILDSVWFDFAYLNSVLLGNINHLFNESINGSLVSAFESKRAEYEGKLEKLLDGYRELGDGE